MKIYACKTWSSTFGPKKMKADYFLLPSRTIRSPVVYPQGLNDASKTFMVEACKKTTADEMTRRKKNCKLGLYKIDAAAESPGEVQP
ncbi:hypothetical protein TNIN_184971 [Trichonephila inaurata madagascariensis]|uniref:Uncharacterized protein n=1 Tax=Trichonephila inaurata madagascariensis TaxID=2747483 RepID=A0A8X6M714_9ARAC|nr:hypothetical protein TNIN_184971 [Trichonephila inaurata madagascariensis]